MSLRAATPCGVGHPRLPQGTQSLVLINSLAQGKSRHMPRLAPVCAQARSGNATEPGSGAQAKSAVMPDPWSSPSVAHDPGAKVAEAVPAGSVTAESQSEASASFAAPPSPWDATDGSKSTAPTRTAAVPTRNSSARDIGSTGLGGSRNASSAAAAAAATEDALFAPSGSSSSSNGDSGAAASGAAAAAAAGKSPTSGVSATAGSSKASGSSINRAGSPGTSSSSIGGASNGGGTAGGARFNMREASAALSEDTAALLSRLRAELARTSNIPMPPRRASGPSSSSSNSNPSTASSSSSSTTTGSSGAATSSRSGSSSSSSGRAAASAPRSGSPGSQDATATATAAPSTAGAGTVAAAAAPAAPSRAPSPSAQMAAPKIGGAAMSTEALTAALSASEAAAIPGSEATPAATPAIAAAHSGGSGTGGSSRGGSGGADAAKAAELGTASTTSDAAEDTAAGRAGGFFGAFLKRRQQAPAPVAPAPAAASSPRGVRSVPNPSTATPSSASASSPTSTPTSASTTASPPAASPPQLGPPTRSNGNSSSSSAAAAASRPLAGSGTAAATAAAATTSTPAAGSGVGIGASGGAVGGGSGRKRRAVVVGGGIGGLVSAARLAKEGFSVTLLEANSQVGGRCQSVQRGRFRFDTGPSLLLFIETYRKAFAALGTSLAQQVPVVRVTPAAYRVFFQGAGSLDLLYDVQRMVEQLEGVELGAGRQYLQWLAGARAALQLGVEGFIERDAEGLSEIISRALQDSELRELLASVGVSELLGPHHARMARRFRDPRLRALFTFQDLYVGLTPYNAPGVYSLLAATELTDGVWYPLGGFGQIRDALLRVAQGLGVRLRCGARVAGINTAAGPGGAQRATGVTLASGEELRAEVVVSNRDVPLTYELLRGPAEAHGSAQSRRLLAADYSAGVISFNWSVDRRLEALLHHNVFLSGDFEGSWLRSTGPDSLARSPNFYVHCPARTDPTACPPGSDSVMVLLPVANIQEIVKAKEAERRRGGPRVSLPGGLAEAAGVGGGGDADAAAAAAVDYSALVAAGREAVFRSMAEAGIPDVRQHIVDELVIDPVEWRDRYSLAHGAAFGLSHGLSQLSVFRPPLSDKQVRGLYLVGASTRPGNGVPLTMISADLLTRRVMQDVEAGVL